ncbi:MAG TPA: methylmalonyl-CoA mutase family protein, partial [Caulobacter sp.]|nr:methylmalonyl-CoA mutase family protein [Caulobacter sp.]
IVKALESGLVADIVGATRAAQEAAFADKRRKILGVTAFPNADDKPVEVATPTADDFAVDPPSVRVPGPDSRCPPLTPIRFSAAFEGAPMGVGA